LQAPDFSRGFILQTDASNRGVGAVLSQRDAEGRDHAVGYFSKKLLPREESYSTVEKECLAIKLSVEAFKVYLLGRQFEIQTDHNALVWLERLKDNNPRLTRWSLLLQPYTFTVTHRKGSLNGNADVLSRITPNNLVQNKERGM
jgi:phospholipid-translocating ATPase